MAVSFCGFITNLISNPSLIFITLLMSGVILLNGWTVAPNSIATCVSTRCLSPRKSMIMSALCSFLGIFLMTFISSKVAETIYSLVNFGEEANTNLLALVSALIAIVLWTILAWKLAIPTSQSHALIAGLSGAAIAMQGGFSGINISEWLKVIYGLIMSTVLGFLAGYGVTRLIEKICKNIDRRKTKNFFRFAQIFGGASMSFMHGAQDGQKFIGVFLLGLAFANGQTGAISFSIPIWLMILCSFFMTLGLFIGGDKIIKTVGVKMTKLDVYQGVAVDFASAGCLLISSIFGIPVSTAHTKSTAVIGVGVSKRLSSVNWSVVKNMVLAWIFTFPGCGLLGYLITIIFTKIFS